MQAAPYKRCKTCDESKPHSAFHSEGPGRSPRAVCGACRNATRRAPRPPTAFPDIYPAFGDWLAGFIDGEGCFTIDRQGGWGYAPRMRLRLRDDDRPLLEAIVACTGLGGIQAVKVHAPGPRRPQAQWRVHRQADCLQLVAILDAHPLRSKKARDYTIWREAVLEWLRMPDLRGARGRIRGNWSRLEQLRDQLMATRRYVEV